MTLLKLVALVALAALVTACDQGAFTRPIRSGGAQTDPAGAAALLPPSLRIALPVDSVLTGDTIGGVTATAFDFSGKIQHQASINWSTHGVGAVTIAGIDPKAQQVTVRGVTRGPVMLVATYTDRWGQTARDSAAFHVAPRTATVGVCQIAKRVADSLGISGDTTMDWTIIGPFCLPDTATVWPVVPGADTTKAYPNPTVIPLSGGLLDAKVRVHILSR